MYIKRLATFGSLIGLAAVFGAADPALAHVGAGGTAGFSSGFAHPLSGVDHLLAMLAVGLWAAQIGGRGRWVIPTAFVGVMILGGAVGIAGFRLPFVEEAILVSVLVLGALIAAAVRAPLGLGAVLVGLFALFHGHAHGTEMPMAIGGVTYSIGFAAATVLLHACGIAMGAVLQRLNVATLVRLAGGAIAVCGIYLAFV